MDIVRSIIQKIPEKTKKYRKGRPVTIPIHKVLADLLTLKERFGPRGGRLLAGVIWGVWHWPVIVLAGYEYGLDYWGAPFVGPLLFCLFTVTLGILLDLVYEKTRCIWYPALAHGAVNAAAGIPTLFLAPAFADRLLLGPAMHGLLAGLPLLLSAAAVLAAKPRKGGEI